MASSQDVPEYRFSLFQSPPKSKRVLNMNFTQSLRWRHEYVVEALWIRKKLCSGCDAKVFMVQCCADSLECSPLLCFLKGHLHIFFMSYTLICFCSQKFRRPLPCSCSCCVLRCFCIVLFKFQWYKCESCICESDPVLDFAVFPLFTTLACCYCVSFLVAT